MPLPSEKIRPYPLTRERLAVMLPFMDLRWLPLLLLPALTACSPPTSIGTNEMQGVPLGAITVNDVRGDPRAAAAWARAGSISVTTWSSGSCPLRPVKIERQAAHQVKVTLRRTERADSCTADSAPTTNRVRLPAGTSEHGPLTVTIDDGERQPPAKIELPQSA